MITTEDKRKICARNFFNDNRDQYEDYHEAAAEFLSGQNVSDRFVDFAVEPYIKPQEGHYVLVGNDGHVATVRAEDGFFSPRTEMTREEGEAIEAAFEAMNDKYPEALELELLEKMGWRVIHTPEFASKSKKETK